MSSASRSARTWGKVKKTSAAVSHALQKAKYRLIELGRQLTFGAASRAAVARQPWAALLSVLALLCPALALAQSADLVKSYQNFEAAKSANRVADAVKYGNQALQLTEEGGDKQTLIELLRSLGDFVAQNGQESQAADYYQRALLLAESSLGPDHPDLVPLLASLADLKFKAKRFEDAEAIEQRILGIERTAYGEQHVNVLATVSNLRDIYRAAGDTEGLARLDDQEQSRS